MKNYNKEALDNTADKLTFGQKIRADWRRTYDLGYKHGFEMGQKNYELKLLKEEIERLQKSKKTSF